jgi:hypothetical protein
MKPPPVNGAGRAEPDVLAGLAKRLHDAGERESYAALVSYIESLPPTDELVKVAKLFGFLTLMGQQLPDAIEAERGELRKLLSGAYTAFQQEVKTNYTYHDQLNERLSRLPDEIASGVKPDDIAAAMAERFRQQIAQTGLEESADILRRSLPDIRAVVNNLDLTIHRFKEQSRTVDQSIEIHSRKLGQMVDEHRWESEKLHRFSSQNRWGLLTGAALIVFALGAMLGFFWSARSSNATLRDMQQQLDRIEQAAKAPAAVSPPAAPKRGKKN